MRVGKFIGLIAIPLALASLACGGSSSETPEPAAVEAAAVEAVSSGTSEEQQPPTPTSELPTAETPIQSDASGVNVGMLADDVLELRGRAERTEVVGEDQSGFRVEWWYPDGVYTMARRSSGGITAYRVVEIRAGASLKISGGPTAMDSNTHQKKSYRVRRGDTLYDISRAHSVSLDQLMRWNSLGPNSTVRPGDELVIWERRSLETN